MVDSLQTRGMEFQNLHHVVGAAGDIRIAEHEQRTELRIGDENYGSFKDRDEGTFRADQCAGNVEAAFGQKVIQVVSRDPSFELGEAFADSVSILVAEAQEFAVDVRLWSASTKNAVAFLIGGWPNAKAMALVGEDFHLMRVVAHPQAQAVVSCHERMHAAGVVAEHAA